MMLEASTSGLCNGDAARPWGKGLFSDWREARLKKRRLSAVRQWPADCGRGVKRRRQGGDVVEEPAVGGDQLAAVVVGPVAGATREFPRRSVSASRKWPTLCGRGVPRVDKNECLRRLAEERKKALPPKQSDDIVRAGNDDNSSCANRDLEVQNKLKVADSDRDVRETIVETAVKLEEKVEEVIGSSQNVLEEEGVTINSLQQDRNCGVKDGVVRRSKVKVEASKQKLGEAEKQVEARGVDELKQSQVNGRSQGLNKVVNDARKKGFGTAALSRSSLSPKEPAKPRERFDGLDRKLAVEVNNGYHKVEEKPERGLAGGEPPQKEAKFRRLKSSVSNEELPLQATDQIKLPQSVSKSNSPSKIVVSKNSKNKLLGDKVISPVKKSNLIREEEPKRIHPFEGLEIVLGLNAAVNCPWTRAEFRPKPDIVSPDSQAFKKKQKRENTRSPLHSVDEVVESQKSPVKVPDIVSPDSQSSRKKPKRDNIRTPLHSVDDVGKSQESPVKVPENINLAIVPLVDFSKSDFEDEVIEPNDKKDNEGPSSYQVSHELDMSLIPFGASDMFARVDDQKAVASRKKVRETLRLFQGCCRKLLQEAEARDKKLSNQRVDLQAYEILKQQNKFVNTGKPILGVVPGVEVGDEFHFRFELCIVGLHRPFMTGIDCTKGRPNLATSIVSSGSYDDKLDDSDVMVYTGQGGRPSAKNALGVDQQLEKGNLALKNSIDAKTPVRVIRGIKEKQTKEKRLVTTYIYYGLYLVEKYWSERGRHGFLEYKFQLRRMPGQPPLAVREVKKLRKSKAREGVYVDDISRGKEMMPICAANTIDNEKPPLFNYVTKMIYPAWCRLEPPKGCSCKDGCSDSEKCLCAVRNGGEIPYNYNGSIVEAKHMVYECGPYCQCAPSCHNRVSQNGIKFKLEVFKTENRGWGVRSLTSIPSGSFVCEYVGEVLQDTEAEKRMGNDEYLFDIGQSHNGGFLQDELSNIIPNMQNNAICERVEDSGFTIDAAAYGNVGRFINHSCTPNLYAQNVFYDHDDKRLPHIMLFAAENIPPLQELTYHYNYTLDQVQDSNGNIKKKECFCGSIECTGRLY